MTTLTNFLLAFAVAFCLTVGYALDPITATDPNCPCCVALPCDCDCCTGVGFWSSYTFTVTGLADNPGNACQCASYNGTFTVTKQVGSCLWVTSQVIPPNDCGNAGAPKWRLTCSNGVFALGNAVMGDIFFADVAGATFCLDGGTMTGGPAGIGCKITPNPSTINVATAGAWVKC